MAASVDFKTYVDQACRAADEFVNIYYETMDKRRRALTRLYLDKATLVWNGNAVSGQEELNKFFEMLPSSEFQVNVLDCQPVHVQVCLVELSDLVSYSSCFPLNLKVLLLLESLQETGLHSSGDFCCQLVSNRILTLL
ncbi:NTF2-related export protein 2 isoform X2 [Dryobates pubescens]|uniref:NTF2-related export protein 2 isoform X2 n=1 Tax=Dryobates pubescens TaxID=118200 RepID=UPI0023B8D2DE|nr:NTF2-related export protein 2 isoform X2 [Dryobates pubescens]